MKDPELIHAQYLFFEAMHRAAANVAARKRNHVAWRIQSDSWHSVRVCSVTEYAPGCIRFRNDLAFDIPRKVWPLPPPARTYVGTMEVTVHDSEVRALAPLILEIANNALHEYESPLFPNGKVTPSYCWSLKATEVYNSQQAAMKARLTSSRKR